MPSRIVLGLSGLLLFCAQDSIKLNTKPKVGAFIVILPKTRPRIVYAYLLTEDALVSIYFVYTVRSILKQPGAAVVVEITQENGQSIFCNMAAIGRLGDAAALSYLRYYILGSHKYQYRSGGSVKVHISSVAGNEDLLKVTIRSLVSRTGGAGTP